MPRISPFVGLRFDPARVDGIERVTAPPYDVISPREHERYLRASPYNVIRLDLGRDPEHVDSPERYRQATEDLRSWRSDGALVETEPAYFPYEMRFSLHGRPRRIRGVIGAVELEDWGGGIVPHEHTMPGPIEDRLRLMRSVEANLSSIYCVAPGPLPRLGAWLDAVTRGEPAASLVDEDGVEHRMWVSTPDVAVTDAVAGTSLMIADGHHRYTTDLRYRDERRAADGAGAWDAAMMLLVDGATEDPPVLPFHRIVRSAQVPAAGVRVRDLEEVLESVDDAKLRYGVVTHEDGALAHRVLELEGEPPAVCRLHEQVIAGLDDELTFTHDAVVAEDAVRRGDGAAAVFLPATDAGTIRSVVDRGDRLPQKSTYFWPKPRTGLVIRPHDA